MTSTTLTSSTAHPTVWVDTPRWFIRPRNTDWRYMKSLGALPNYGGPNTIYGTIPRDIFSESASYVMRRFGLPACDTNRRINGAALHRLGAVAVLNHSVPAVWSREPSLPTLWRHEILDPEMLVAAGMSKEARGARVAHMARYLGRVERIITATAAARERNAALFPEHAGKFVNIPFFLPGIKALSTEIVIEKQRKADPVEVLFVGGEGYRKGLDLVLKGWRTLPLGLRRQARLSVVSQEMRPEWREGVDFEYYSTLPHDEILSRMRKAHIFIMPSRVESLGFVYLEAMAAGCAVIGAQWESQRDILDSGRAGICSAPEVNKIRLALEELIGNASMRAGFALTGHRRFCTHYEADAVAKLYLRAVEGAAE